MKLRLGAAVIAVALTALTSATASGPASAGTVDTSAPAVGSCHDLTRDEAWAETEPDPAVPCTARHTSVTLAAVDLGRSPHWSDTSSILRAARTPCERALIHYFDGRVRELSWSAYSYYVFFPTRAQRRAGATWLRCDVALAGSRRMSQLPTDGPAALGSLPLPESQAGCRQGKAQYYAQLRCSDPHSFRTTDVIKHPGSRFPGANRMKHWAQRKCASRLGRNAFFYEWPDSRAAWKLGNHFAICEKKTRA